MSESYVYTWQAIGITSVLNVNNDKKATLTRLHYGKDEPRKFMGVFEEGVISKHGKGPHFYANFEKAQNEMQAIVKSHLQPEAPDQ